MYDGCSDVSHTEGTELLRIYPSCDESLERAREFIKKHSLTKEDCRMLKGKGCIRLVAKREITLTFLYEGSAEDGC